MSHTNHREYPASTPEGNKEDQEMHHATEQESQTKNKTQKQQPIKHALVCNYTQCDLRSWNKTASKVSASTVAPNLKTQDTGH